MTARTTSITASKPHIVYTQNVCPVDCPIEPRECKRKYVPMPLHSPGPWAIWIVCVSFLEAHHFLSNRSISKHLPNFIGFAARAIKNAMTMCTFGMRREARACRQRWVTIEAILFHDLSNFPANGAVAVHTFDWESTAKVIKILAQFEHFESMFAYFDRIAMDFRAFHVSIEWNLDKSF